MIRVLVTGALALSLVACSSSYHGPNGPLTRITTVDRNGITQTVSAPDKLSKFDKSDFLGSQPYQKVLRTFKTGADGSTHAVVTSYHPNGQIMQLLQVQNGRALGTYREWFANGQLKIDCQVMGGVADLTVEAARSWLFHGISRAWEENGALAAEVHYEKGSLHGKSTEYHGNGKIWKISNYSKGKLEDEYQTWRPDGSLLYSMTFHQGVAHGYAKRSWTADQLAAEEEWEHGRLHTGVYWNPDGSEVSRVTNGSGFRPEFGRDAIAELHEYREGEARGLVEEYLTNGRIGRTYYVEKGQLHGLDTHFYHEEGTAKVQTTWERGVIEGEVKTWYASGAQESAREYHQNKRQGLSTAWYEDGTLMLMEEYEANELKRGQYLRRGQSDPISSIEGGSGVATIFDGSGALVRRVTYKRGLPEIN